MSNFHATLLTIFPEMFPGPLSYSLAGKALQKNIWSFDIINIRGFGVTKHKNVDAKPYGGGNGLVMRPDVLGSALDSAIHKAGDNTQIYYPSPRGKLLSQEEIKQISQEKKIILLCGRFEGIDERIIQEYNPVQFSVAECVFSGGEVPAIAMLDAVIRLLPGVLENPDTLLNESFETEIEGQKLIEHPLYTKPEIWRNIQVPEVLLSGNHKKIREWNLKESIRVSNERKEK